MKNYIPGAVRLTDQLNGDIKTMPAFISATFNQESFLLSWYLQQCYPVTSDMESHDRLR